MRNRFPHYRLYSLFFLILIGGCILTLVSGDAPWDYVWKETQLRLQGLSTEWNPLLDERLPRLIVLLCTGASLAVSGAVMQALFHNPLASPSVLGISCGGSLMVVCVFILGWQIAHPYTIPLAAFSGCLLALLGIYLLSRQVGGMQMTSLLLTGIAISTLLLAIQDALTYALRDRWQLIQALTEWEAGSTADRTWQHVHMQLPLTLVGLLGCLHYMREIDILALGDEEAKNLGVEVEKVRWRLFLCVALLTGGAIAAVGVIAFFGLILPHVIRKLVGPLNSRLIPLCVLSGSTVLICLDLFLRLLKIQVFSIGNVSAILGAFFFLIILFEERNKASAHATN